MPNDRRVICLELNELSTELLNLFIQAGELPAFDRLRNQSIVATTDAEASGKWLHSTTQWQTVYSGLPHHVHQEDRLALPSSVRSSPVVESIADSGRPIAQCGTCFDDDEVRSLNEDLSESNSPIAQLLSNDELELLSRFFLQRATDDRDHSTPIGARETLGLFRSLRKRGLTGQTAQRILQQLFAERTRSVRWKRPLLLDAIQCDLFEEYYSSHRPALSMFRSHTASHFQRRYWRYFQPELFPIRASASDLLTFRTALLECYRSIDQTIERFLRLDPQATIMVVPGLGQRAFPEHDQAGSSRESSFVGREFLEQQLAPNRSVFSEPTFGPEFRLRFENCDDAATAVNALESLIDSEGRPAFELRQHSNRLTGIATRRSIAAKEELLTDQKTRQKVLLSDLVRIEQNPLSSHADPEGIFWIRQPGIRHRVVQQPISLTQIAPTILDILDLPCPSELQGASLFESPAEDISPVRSHHLQTGRRTVSAKC
ncbi:hypothetical protein KOR42_31510 [Thalassoglobus neptunius]|uniref:Uncharacterized protein n=1 Tax=Thalassoglobus neptunius TaxID=1938619 RepID=A0A5C5WML3_9PLAN|nr:hypothetical protein [Thalassoglobus neptunius]TWT52054.1 hypothetical protein KOR42_31510 [Thalassoglobus neptunius]